MTQYETGRRFEYAVRKALTEDGYECVRSAGSKTKIDIIAFKPQQVLFIQAKRDGKISPAERGELLRMANLISATPLVAWKRTGSTAVLYWRLTGPGPQERVEWSSDEVMA